MHLVVRHVTDQTALPIFKQLFSSLSELLQKSVKNFQKKIHRNIYGAYIFRNREMIMAGYLPVFFVKKSKKHTFFAMYEKLHSGKIFVYFPDKKNFGIFVTNSDICVYSVKFHSWTTW